MLEGLTDDARVVISGGFVLKSEFLKSSMEIVFMANQRILKLKLNFPPWKRLAPARYRPEEL